MFKKLFGAMLLTSQVAMGATVSSINKPHRIDISGFEQADNAAHMLDWLGKGKDFRQYIVADIEKELYAQDKGSQLSTKQKPSKMMEIAQKLLLISLMLHSHL